MSYTLSFVKMHGAGNDFIMIDGRTLPALNLSCAQIAALCHRQLGVGADGLIVIRHDPEVDFCMVYYNANGSEAEMCGNGARCAVAFAQRFGMVGDHCRFQTSAGVLIGRLVDREVSVSLPPWRDWRPDLKLEGSPHASHHFVNTGVPHLVIPVSDVASVDVAHWGPFLRNHPVLRPDGANVNWVQTQAVSGVYPLRTYERGVEAETLACGTGAAAAAVVLCQLRLASTPVAVLSRGGERLIVKVNLEPTATALELQGPAAVSFRGEVEIHDS